MYEEHMRIELDIIVIFTDFLIDIIESFFGK